MEIRRLLNEAASNKACLTMKEAIRVVNIVVTARKTDLYFGKTICDTTMPRWLITNGFMMSKPLTSYEVKARVDRVTINNSTISSY